MFNETYSAENDDEETVGKWFVGIQCSSVIKATKMVVVVMIMMRRRSMF